jgi:hypothetical protein
MHGVVTRFSKINSSIRERIADLHDLLAQTRRRLEQVVAEGAAPDAVNECRWDVSKVLDELERLLNLERHRR